MKTLINIDLIKTLEPCKDRLNNAITYYKNRSFTKGQLMGLKNISHSDKLWVAFRLMPLDKLRFAAAEIAELVLPIFEKQYPNDNRPRLAIEAAKAKVLDVDATRTARTDADAASTTAHAIANAAYTIYAVNRDTNYAAAYSANADTASATANAAYSAYAAANCAVYTYTAANAYTIADAAANSAAGAAIYYTAADTAHYATNGAADSAAGAYAAANCAINAVPADQKLITEKLIRKIILKYWKD